MAARLLLLNIPWAALAGLPGAIGSVPDGMAASVLAGVNPIHGLYASFAGPVAGGLSASTKLMLITTTSAAALAAGSAVENLSPEDRPAALFLLTLMAGAAMIAAGLLRLGRFTRFVSHSVMVGFLSGVSVNIIAGQIPDLTGAEAEGSVAVQKAWNVLIHPSRIDAASVLAGCRRVRHHRPARPHPHRRLRRRRSRLAVPTIAVVLLGADVAQVEDQGDIPRGIPLPAWPELSAFSWSLLGGALAVAAIVLVQGVGVAESAPNDDGTRSDANVDFIAQGIGNLGSGFFQGQPVGGSVGQTALNRAAGARTRWASIFSGLWMLLILALFSGVVGVVAMPTLAALLIYAAAGSLHFGQIATIWRTGLTSQIAIASHLRRHPPAVGDHRHRRVEILVHRQPVVVEVALLARGEQAVGRGIEPVLVAWLNSSRSIASDNAQRTRRSCNGPGLDRSMSR